MIDSESVVCPTCGGTGETNGYAKTRGISWKMREAEMWVDVYILEHKKPPTYAMVREHFNLKSSCAAYSRLRHCRGKMKQRKEK